MKTILLFGGTGLVGRSIRANSQFSNFKWHYPGRDQVNLLSESEICDFMIDVRPDFVIHAAGRVGGIKTNSENQYEFMHENTMMGMNIVNAVRIYNETMSKKVRLLNLASSCMYSLATPQPFQPHSILGGKLEPTNEGYALSKILVTRATQYMAQRDPDSFKTIIPCNLYGPWDKFDEDKAHLIPAIIAKLHKAKSSGEESVKIWGSGEVRREFMYSEDLADFIYFALTNWEQIPTIMNVGVGNDYSVEEYYHIVAEVLDCTDLKFEYDSTKPVGVYSKLCDVSEQEKLGWTPQTALYDGIYKTYRSFLTRMDLEQ